LDPRTETEGGEEGSGPARVLEPESAFLLGGRFRRFGRREETKMHEARVTVPALARMKREGARICMLTAYDFAFARIFDAAGIDVLLVGDSLGDVVQGNDTTLPVTLDEMIYHTRMVARAARRALVVGDMPFGSYQPSVERALDGACRLVKEGGAHAVKLEGGARVADRIEALARMDVPVMAHVGLTPQSVHKLGGYRVQGRGPKTREAVLADALAVQAAGAFAVVLECVPADLAAEVTRRLAIPTLGIGAGVGCDGQVLVMHDLLGLGAGPAPRFARRYVALGELAARAARMYAEDVRAQKFPSTDESY
jgi:3-methyl-2-oxobutanoate hydroxymethyltransferase